MLEISEQDVAKRLARDNPWWAVEAHGRPFSWDMPERDYFDRFQKLATNTDVRRAIILMGPRRVGKTVMLTQLIKQLVGAETPPANILYASIDTPIYTGIPLERFVQFLAERPQFVSDKYGYVIFDEIQYLRNWESHLKDLVDAYPRIRFVASGSAAAALRLASKESGAGRFSDFKLPPLTFAEFLRFIDREGELISETSGDSSTPVYEAKNVEALNEEFINYLNYGGYPEAVMNPQIRSQSDQFVKNDIIDKVLLKDLPALYGIQNIQELNRLFSFIAYNTGQEVSLNSISQKMEISKPTVARYIEYLESAFLIIRISRVDASAKTLKRATSFKVHLTNSSMRAAIFAPVEIANNDLVGHLTESAIFSQWAHSRAISTLYYGRWDKGEVDLICMQGASFSPSWAVEIKWADDLSHPMRRFTGLAHYIENNDLDSARITTKTKSGELCLKGLSVPYSPSSLYCYTVGKNLALHAPDYDPFNKQS